MNESTMMNVVTMQCNRCYANIPMNTSAISNVVTMQRRGCYANIPKKPPHIMNALTTQLGTSCSFDSPGLARNEPTPGKHLHGDSTPSVLSFFCEGMGITMGFMANYA
ncbi:MAG: tetrahydrofolate synthase [Prevotella salivae]|nr:tetrahydrofolate synthase [Segatella salivae]